jgi:hypothetical protein
MTLSISGCKKAEENNINQNENDPVSTQAQISRSTSTSTPKQSSTSDKDESWIKAYYDYIVNNESQYDLYLLLIDLNFDGVPELFNIFIADGSQAYQKGITFMNGKVMPIGNDKMKVSVFVGTMKNSKGEKVWYTRYYPFAFHNSTGAEIDINNYSCQDLNNITAEALFQINFANTSSDDPNASSINVSIIKNGKNIDVTSQDRQSIINWYLNDKNSDFGSDWYNNQRLTVEELNSLLPLAQFEGQLDIQEQKSANVDLSKCYTATNGKDSLDYNLFYNQVMNWNNEDQIKQWEFFKQ